MEHGGELHCFGLRMASWLVCAWKVLLPTSTRANCNEVGSQLSRRAHISRVSSLKTPGEQNDVLEFSMSVQNAYTSLLIEI